MKEKKNPWLPLFITNFFSVFNDNVIKWLVIFVGVSWVGIEHQPYVIPIASSLLVIPFILFSPLAGKFAKIYEKKSILVWGKLAEIPIMLIAILGFYIQSLPVVMTSILLMGLQSTMFSPAKYGLIRDIRGNEGISFGTGMMEMLTFVGVLLGTVLAGVLSDYLKTDYNISLLSAILLSVAFVGWITAKIIKADESPVIESTGDTLNPFLFIYKQFKVSNLFPGVNDAIFGLSLFWLIGSMIQMNIADHSPNVLGESDTMTGVIMSVTAIGIAVGAILTGWLSGKRVHLGYVIIGSIGLGITMFLIVFINPATNLFMVMIFTAAFFAGFFKIPLNAFIQDAVKGRKLGDILGYLNVMVFTFILISAGIYAAFNMSTLHPITQYKSMNNSTLLANDTLILDEKFNTGDIIEISNLYSVGSFYESKDTISFSYTHIVNRDQMVGDTFFLNEILVYTDSLEIKDTAIVGGLINIGAAQSEGYLLDVQKIKFIGNSLYVFFFIGFISLGTGLYYFFKVNGVKEDFFNIIKGNLGR